ncbi:hypothetical protein [Bacillus phage vB_BceM_Bc431v3]|uniref:Uncharacterized protein n=1 Tax=Bacillus phage vB_BceM_Bc431v3 TaxID=1195072 RepID=M4HPZ8_9CAUD|nr:hypothetical protein K201_gp112 [Bacillus phage vB_BceM_Bc431v3]AFQ96420.1 hypothetical protein [Bacillus phage vB_BceM_Bc431v3]
MNTNKLLGFGKTYGSSGGVFFTSIDVTDKPEYVGVMVKDKEEAELVTDIVKSYVGKDIRSKFLHRVDRSLLEEFKGMAHSCKFIEERVDYYNTEEDPGLCTRTQIEGVGYGWYGKQIGDDYDRVIKGLRNDADALVLSTEKDLDDEVTIFAVVIEFENKVVYHFIGRPRLQADAVFTFSDDEILQPWQVKAINDTIPITIKGRD